MKHFKDEETGERFEAVPIRTTDGTILIRPVEPEPKWSVDLVEWEQAGEKGWNIKVTTQLCEDQAQLIKDWISAGMKNLNSPMNDFPNEVAETYNAARTAMRENN